MSTPKPRGGIAHGPGNAAQMSTLERDSDWANLLAEREAEWVAYDEREQAKVSALELRVEALEAERKRLTEHLFQRHSCDFGYDSDVPREAT